MIDHKLFGIYILSIPLISAFSISPTLPIPLLVSLTLFAWYVVRKKMTFTSYDLSLLTILSIGIVAQSFAGESFMSGEYLSSKNLNHTIAFLFSIICYYYVPKLFLKNNLNLYKVGKYLAISLVITSGFIIFEFTVTNYFSINLLDYIPYSRDDLSGALVNGILFRARGFAEEGGHMSLFYEFAFPISLIYINQISNIINKVIYWLICLVGFTLLFSSAGFVCLLIAAIVPNFLKLYKKRSLKFILSSVFLIGFLFASNITRPYIQATVLTKASIFSSSSEQISSSALQRSSRYANALELFEVAPLGSGWGTMSGLSRTSSANYKGVEVKFPGFNSLYLELLLATGIIGLSIFVYGVFRRLIQVIKSRDPDVFLVSISYISLILHYVFVSNYWFPYLWFCFAIVDTLTYRSSYLSTSFFRKSHLTMLSS